MKTTNFLKVVVVMLLLINATLLFFIINRPGPMGRSSNANHLFDKISLQLELSKDQKRQYEVMRNEHREMMNSITVEEQKLTKALFSFLTDDNSRLEEKDVLKKKIQELEIKKISVTYEHFEDLKGICTEEQLVYFPDIVEEISSVLLGKRRRMHELRPVR